MQCPKCGVTLQDGTTFCSDCGTKISDYNMQTNVANPAANNQTPKWAVSGTNQKMGWFKFLIYFALFAGALVNFSTGIQLLTGSHYGTDADTQLVYSVFSELKSVDTLVGVLCLGLAALGVYTRFRLAGFHQNGPTLLTIQYVCVIITDLIYIVGVSSSIRGYNIDLDFSSFISNVIISAVMAVVNYIYFKKRAHMFI